VKVVVLGGTGLIGSRLARRLRGEWHDVVVASPSTGVDAVTGTGLGRALEGAEVVVDVSDTPSREPGAALDHFERSSRRVLAVERAYGAWHHVALSVVGADRAAGGYLLAKAVQEEVIARSGRPATVVRAAPCFESVGRVADAAWDGAVVRLPAAVVRAVAAGDVVEVLAGVVAGRPVGGVLHVVGPEPLPLAEVVVRVLRAAGDGRPVVVDETAGDAGGLDPAPAPLPAGCVVAETTLAQWLRAGGVTDRRPVRS
jgi:uncharacterized protein YbjT (DUF2867 family)